MVSQLQLSGYRERSCQSYLKAVQQLQRFCNKPLSQIRQKDLQAYWLACRNDYGWSPATLRISYSGIKFFFSRTLVRRWKLLNEVRFRREQTLPTVLSGAEVKRILCALPTLQSKVFYVTLYSLGLRLLEAVTLQVRDIDGPRGLVHIRGGKGAGDRTVPLPPITRRALRAYYKTHKNPRWLFPAIGHNQWHLSGRAAKPVSKSAVQAVLRRTVERLGITKHVHPHVFRHSYATHLLEANVPIHHVQKLLGHKTLQSTIVYLHVTTLAESHSHQKVCQVIQGVLS
jgi:site-specific recombinase XerD